MNRRRRKLSLSQFEILEPRQLLTGDVIAVQATTHDILEPSTSSCLPMTPAVFQITDTGTGGVDTVDFDVTTSGSLGGIVLSAGAYIYLSGDGHSGEVDLSGGESAEITVTPDDPSPNINSKITLSLTIGCMPATYSISPSSDTVTIVGTPNPEVSPFCDPGPLATTGSPGTGNVTPEAMSPAGVAYGSGGVSPRSPSLLQSNGFGTLPVGVDLGWTNLTGFANVSGSTGQGSIFGEGMSNPDLPYLEPGNDGGLVAVEDAGNGIFFTYDSGSGTYSPEFYSQDALTSDGSSGYLLTQSDGTSSDYYGFGGSIPAAQQGQLDYYTDANGNTTTTTYNGSGQLTSIQRTDGTTTLAYDYSYVSGGVNDGLVSNVTQASGPAGGTLTTIQQVAFTYYDGTTDYGNQRDLETETLEDASGDALGTTYYRYYTAADVAGGGNGYVGA